MQATVNRSWLWLALELQDEFTFLTGRPREVSITRHFSTRPINNTTEGLQWDWCLHTYCSSSGVWKWSCSPKVSSGLPLSKRTIHRNQIEMPTTQSIIVVKVIRFWQIIRCKQLLSIMAMAGFRNWSRFQVSYPKIIWGLHYSTFLNKPQTNITESPQWIWCVHIILLQEFRNEMVLLNYWQHHRCKQLLIDHGYAWLSNLKKNSRFLPKDHLRYPLLIITQHNLLSTLLKARNGSDAYINSRVILE